jgi:hypothetical protein
MNFQDFLLEIFNIALPNLMLLSKISFEDICEIFPVFIDSKFIDFLTNAKIIDHNCPIFLAFMDILNNYLYLIRDSDFLSEVQSIKALALLDINKTYSVSNPLLCQILTAKLNLLCDIKINYILFDTVATENYDLKDRVFGLYHYNLIEDSNAFFHKISKIEYQPYLLNRDELNELHSLTHSSSSSSSSSESDVFTLTSDFASPSKKIKRL